jgi:chromosome segregation ATPase
MADAPVATEGEGGLERLQAFVDLLEATRERLGGAREDLRARADQAADDAGRAASGLRLMNDLLAARGEGVTALQGAAVAELAALATAAGTLAQHRAAEETLLEAGGAALDEATAAAQAGLEEAVARRESDFAEVETVVAGLERAASALHAALESPRQEIGLAERVLAQADLDLQAELAGAQHEAADLLRPAVEGLLAGHRARLDDEAAPYVAGALDELEAGLTRAFQELSLGVEASAASLARETVVALEHQRDAALEAAQRHEALSTEVERGGVQPMRAAGDRAIAMLEDAVEACSALAALAPRLSAARDVAQQVDDMLDSLNPLD